MASNFIQAARNTVYVANLSWTVGSRELRNYFAKFGSVTRANVVFDKDTGISKRYGFVSFKNEVSVKSAVETDNHSIDGKPVYVALGKQRNS